MSKIMLSLTVPDVSALAKTIRRELDARAAPKNPAGAAAHAPRPAAPSHVELLNILARGAGFRNFQHLKASQDAEMRLASAPPPVSPEPVDHARVEQVLRCFDGDGVWVRWPKKTSQQKLALWWCWALLPARRDLSEPEVNEILKRLNGFGDHVLIRRELVDWGMVSRSTDCRVYRRIESRPPAEAASLIHHLKARMRAQAVPTPSNRPGRDPSVTPGMRKALMRMKHPAEPLS